MLTDISENPAEKTGIYVSELLANSSEPTLVLLSGGSALSVLDFIDTTVFGDQTVFMMGDDRYTKDSDGNNFSLLKNNPFYNKLSETKATVFSTAVQDHVTAEEFAHTMNNTLQEFLDTNPKKRIIGLFGVGEDGHTASIFPYPKDQFATIYQDDRLFISTLHKGDKYPERVTITTYFIDTYINEVILYAVGETKCKNVLPRLFSEKTEPYELPAIIPARRPNSRLFTDCQSLFGIV